MYIFPRGIWWEPSFLLQAGRESRTWSDAVRASQYHPPHPPIREGVLPSLGEEKVCKHQAAYVLHTDSAQYAFLCGCQRVQMQKHKVQLVVVALGCYTAACSSLLCCIRCLGATAVSSCAATGIRRSRSCLHGQLRRQDC